MIRYLVSDLGNVVLPLDPLRVCRSLVRPGDDPAMLCLQVGRIHRELGMGRGMGAPEEFHREVCSALGLELGYAEFCRVWSDIFWEDQDAVALIRQARVQGRFLLSNTDPIHWEWIREHHPSVLAPFDRCFVSHEHGLEKPDPEFYRVVIGDGGEPAGRYLFVDDLPANVEGARAVGMDAVLYQGADSLREALTTRGLL